MDFPDRFWSKVDKSGDCWLWTAARNPTTGYGAITVRTGLVQSTHRVSWELENGPIAAGLWVLHRCDNPPCVRPSHLFLGSQADNMKDMRTKGRGAHKLTVAQVREIREATERIGDLARRYSVKRQRIAGIRQRKEWTWLP